MISFLVLGLVALAPGEPGDVDRFPFLRNFVPHCKESLGTDAAIASRRFSSINAVSFSSARPTKRFPSSRLAPAIQIVRRLESSPQKAMDYVVIVDVGSRDRARLVDARGERALESACARTGASNVDATVRSAHEAVTTSLAST